MHADQIGGATLHIGDVLAVLAGYPDNHFDAVLTDPPYHLTSIVKRFGRPGSAPAKFGTDGAFARAGAGFMGKEWDGGDIAFRPETWAEVLRVLKPGGMIAAFGGSRTAHRLAVAIEDAGFEIRDTALWMYGSGFPKSHDVGKGVDKADISASLAAAFDGYGTALKPAYEPVILGMKPLDGTFAQNAAKWGVAGLAIDRCRVEGGPISSASGTRRSGGIMGESSPLGGWSPSHAGRWPANILHDGSPEVMESFAAFGEKASGAWNGKRSTPKTRDVLGAYASHNEKPKSGDTGTAARFFYSAKAAADDRWFLCKICGTAHPSKERKGHGHDAADSAHIVAHPTVKPGSLTRYFADMLMPPSRADGEQRRLLVPFAGSGSEAIGGLRAGWDSVTLIEREEDYAAIARARIGTGSPEGASAPMPEQLDLLEAVQ